MKENLKDYWKEFGNEILLIIITLMIGIFVSALFILNIQIRQLETNSNQLNRELAETKEQLMISNNQLQMIEMKSEGEKYHKDSK